MLSGLPDSQRHIRYSAVIAREGGRSSNRQTIITGCPAFAGHDRPILSCAKQSRSSAPALFENPLHLRAAAVVVAHQVVDRPAYVLVAALLARLELVG